MKFLSTLALVICFLTGFTQTHQQIRNLTAFSKLYGYVQYFHPSDEASKIQWQSFAIYGSQQMLKVKDDQELISSLNKLFLPIAPTMQIFSEKEPAFDVNKISPQNLDGYVPVYWQHIGLKLPYFTNIYNSIRINRINPVSEQRIKQNAFALISPINVASFRGKKFKLTLNVNSDIEDLVLKPYLDKLNFVKVTSNLTDERAYVFDGVFDQRSESFTIAIESNINSASAGSINLNKLHLTVLNEDKSTDIPVIEKAIAVNELDSKIDARIIRIFRKQGDDKLFDQEIKIGEFINKSLVPGITCFVPLALYGNENNTYPIVAQEEVNEIIKLSNDAWPKDKNGEFKITGADLSVRLADLIILFNALGHSYPYWDDASQSAEKVWHSAIGKAFLDITDHDFLVTLKQIANLLNDGHMFIDLFGDSDKDVATLPLLFDIAEGKIIVKRILDSRLNERIKVGDELIEIDGKNPFEVLRSLESVYSGSRQWKRAKSIVALSKGLKNETCHLKMKRGKVSISDDISRTHPYSEYIAGSDRNNKGTSEWITEEIFYINLNKTTTQAHMAEIARAKSVIIDMRGYLREDTETFLSHLTTKKLIANSGMFTPEILYPDYQNVSYVKGAYDIEPAMPLIKAKIFLLCDATSQSATESFLSAYKQFKLATIVGQPSSGTNGNINLISMPGGYRFFYSGMLVKNPDGSKHHLNGVTPDIIVQNTITGILNGKDEVLEKAIRVASKN